MQWIHRRDYCGSLTSAAADITLSYEAGELHMSGAAAPVAEGLQDVPLCGTESQSEPCFDCGDRHQRCCTHQDDPWWWLVHPESIDGCDETKLRVLPNLGLGDFVVRSHRDSGGSVRYGVRAADRIARWQTVLGFSSKSRL